MCPGPLRTGYDGLECPALRRRRMMRSCCTWLGRAVVGGPAVPALGPVTGECEENVVDARLPNRECIRLQAVTVEGAEHLEQDPRALVRSDPNSVPIPLDSISEAFPEHCQRALGSTVAAEAQLDDGVPEIGLQPLRSVVCDHLPIVDDGDARGEPVRLLQVLGREQNGRAIAHQLADHLPELISAREIEPGGGLI